MSSCKKISVQIADLFKTLIDHGGDKDHVEGQHKSCKK
jgi:hypothetical protein